MAEHVVYVTKRVKEIWRVNAETREDAQLFYRNRGEMISEKVEESEATAYPE